MLRITELRLPLGHADDALRAGVLARLGLAEAELRRHTVFRRAYDARRKSAVVLIYTVDCELAARRRRGRAAAPPRRRPAPAAQPRHALPLHRPRAGRLPRRRPPAAAGRRLRPLRPVRGADPGPDGAAAARAGARPHACASARRTPGACGAAACSTPNRTCSSAKAAPAPSPTASCGARSATRATSRARCSPNSSRPARPRRSCSSPSRTSAPSGWSSMIEKMRAEIEALGGEIRFRQRVTDLRIEDGHVRGVTLAQRRADRRRPRRAGARPQRARHLRDAAPARRAHGAQAVLGGRAHRAPAERDRPRALRRQRRPPDPGRGRLQAGAPRRQRPLASTASACARAARWSPPRRSRAASSPTA